MESENIRNIIFDLGRVLIHFQPIEYIEKEIPEEKREIFHKEIFESPEWLMLDRGVLTYERAKEIFKQKVTGLDREIDEFFDAKFFGMIRPIEENTVLLPKLKEKYKLYVLSNFHQPAYEFVNSEYSFFRLFDGEVVSCYCHMLKPEKEIYETLLNKYGLIPSETVFIDDTGVNIEAAEKLGIKGIHLPDYTRHKEKLEDFF